MKFNLGNLANCNLDEANYYLAQGRASKENAEEYVKMWNSGIRFTVARLEERLVNLGGCECLAPVIKLEE